MSFQPPGDCPNCGEYVEAGASSCDSCGSCSNTGWNEEAIYDGLDLPEDDATEASPRSADPVVATVTTLLLIAALAYVFIFR